MIFEHLQITPYSFLPILSGIQRRVIKYILETFKDVNGFFHETIKLPDNFGMVKTNLYGPSMGDEPVDEIFVKYIQRPGHPYKSRIINSPARKTNIVTVIAGPVEGQGTSVVYTINGGPYTPKEPGDPTLEEHEKEESIKFWKEHALAKTSLRE